MSLAIDPVISNVLFTLSLIPHFSTPAIGQDYKRTRQDIDLPRVTVLVPLFKEKREDVEMTLTSLIKQSFPNDKMEVTFVVEPEDNETRIYVDDAVRQLRARGIESKVVLSSGKPRMKARALNAALQSINTDFICVYDASDFFEPNQIEQAVSLMVERNYDVVQAKVYREGRSILSRFLTLDTRLWFKKYIPLILELTGGFPLSGEGLFIRKDVLEEVGSFPEVLTEDAYLGLLLTENGKRFALLESVVVEKAPRSLQAHFRQKLRWYRGYLTCLRLLFKSKLDIRKKLSFSLLFGVPIVGALAFISWLFLIGSWASSLLLLDLDIVAPWVVHPIYVYGLGYWSWALLLVGWLIGIRSYLSVIERGERIRFAKILLLVPLYWIYVSICSISAFFQSKHRWYKTER